MTLLRTISTVYSSEAPYAFEEGTVVWIVFLKSTACAELPIIIKATYNYVKTTNAPCPALFTVLAGHQLCANLL